MTRERLICDRPLRAKLRHRRRQKRTRNPPRGTHPSVPGVRQGTVTVGQGAAVFLPAHGCSSSILGASFRTRPTRLYTTVGLCER